MFAQSSFNFANLTSAWAKFIWRRYKTLYFFFYLLSNIFMIQTCFFFIQFLSIFWFHRKNIQHSLTLKRKEQENTEQVRSLVAKFLPSLPLRGKAHTYVYRFQQIEIPYSHYSKWKSGCVYVYISFFFSSNALFSLGQTNICCNEDSA